jgi:RNA polymerase sigma factor (sigma-70 family)
MSESATQAAVEAVARNSYGRLVAYLAARCGDIASAEDALSDAFAAALERWPQTGVPEKPEAWLLHAARNRLIDAGRHAQVRKKAEPLLQIAEEAKDLASMQTAFPDERLKLLFVCAHPAIDVAARTPLMLQTVLGLTAARIGPAFLVSPDAMEQRLVRAKTKIREARIPFKVPEPPQWDERASFVLDAIYSAYAAGWDEANDPEATHHPLAAQAVVLGRTLVQLLPHEPEAHGLLALMLHCEARRGARFSPEGEFVPLDQQDTSLWSKALMEEAEVHLRTAHTFRQIGRYQLEAAIQSIHASRASTGIVDWREIALLYEGLVRLCPTVGAQVGRAVALAKALQPSAGLDALDTIPARQRESYQPWWAARAHILRWLGRKSEARTAFEHAAKLSGDPALRAYLLRQAAAC